MRYSFTRSSIIFFAFFLASCGTSIEENTSLPLGPFTATGTISSAPISLIRRGTHLFRSTNAAVFYIESTTFSLSAYSGTTVKVAGILLKNSVPNELPVLVVETLEELSKTKETLIPEFGLALTLPPKWSLIKKDGSISLTFSGSNLLTLESSTVKHLPTAKKVNIGSLLAYEISTTPRAYLLLHSDQPMAIVKIKMGAERRTEVENILATFREISKSNSSSTSIFSSKFSSGSGVISGSNAPCGGSAGLLCPKGEFCEVQDISNRIGRCRSR